MRSILVQCSQYPGEAKSGRPPCSSPMEINFTFITVAYLKPGCYFIRIYMHTRHHFLFLSIISHFRSGNPLTRLVAEVGTSAQFQSQASAVHCLAEDKRYKFPCHHSKSQPAKVASDGWWWWWKIFWSWAPGKKASPEKTAIAARRQTRRRRSYFGWMLAGRAKLAGSWFLRGEAISAAKYDGAWWEQGWGLSKRCLTRRDNFGWIMLSHL